MKKYELKLDMHDIETACHVIATAPAQRAVREVERAKRIHTPKRHDQACLAAGRTAIAEVLFVLYPELNKQFGQLTKALRRGLGDDVNFDELNLQGAVALGLVE